ncbi:hypothetical protein KXX57_006408, partial [Aspergillus fumigatus]
MAGKTCLSHDDYTVGWICALPLEMAAATVMLDEKHEKLRRQPNDHNEYVLGHIGEHNIVVACLPSGEYGITSATTVAMQLLSSFHSIHFGLMVGIGGGVPKEDKDIRLGDIVVSEPTYTHGGVVQYNYGKALSGGEFRRTGMLNRPPQSLLTALSKLQATHYTKPSQVINFLAEIEQKLPTEQAANFARPTQTDQLFLDNYEHTNTHTQTCNGCDTTQTIRRQCRSHNNPFIHYGLIASANQVVKDSQLRDKLGRDLGVLCVEMEAAGLMNNYPCLVIRGICDYADSHKNKEWQGYAAAVAAAYAKELLLTVSADQTRNTRAITNVPSSPTLHSVLAVPEDINSPVRTLHLSFREFLLNTGEEDLHVNERLTHGEILSHCLGVMKSGLKRNVCGLSSYGTLREDVASQVIDQYIPQALQYSCRYWMYHFEKAGDKEREKDIFPFLKEYFIHWLEAMSLLGLASETVGIIGTLRTKSV